MFGQGGHARINGLPPGWPAAARERKEVRQKASVPLSKARACRSRLAAERHFGLDEENAGNDDQQDEQDENDAGRGSSARSRSGSDAFDIVGHLANLLFSQVDSAYVRLARDVRTGRTNVRLPPCPRKRPVWRKGWLARRAEIQKKRAKSPAAAAVGELRFKVDQAAIRSGISTTETRG